MALEVDTADTQAAMYRAVDKIIGFVAAQGEGEHPQIAAMCADLDVMQTEMLSYYRGLAKSMETVRPVFVMLSKKGNGGSFPVIVMEVPRTRDAQVALATPLTMLVAMAPIDGYFFLAEAWMAIYHRSNMRIEDGVVVPDQMPTQRSDRRECLVTGCYRNGEEKVALFEIMRDDAKNVIDLVLVDDKENDTRGLQGTLLKSFFLTDDKAEKVVAWAKALKSDPSPTRH